MVEIAQHKSFANSSLLRALALITTIN